MLAIWKQSEEVKLMLTYRYITILMTSFFFIVGDQNQHIEKKVFILASIVISSVILNYLYILNMGNTKNIALLVLIETAGNCFILIPSGGLRSPYVWCCLNTILISSIELKRRYCWINLSVYIFASTCLSFLVLNAKNESFLGIINNELNLLLSLILITIAIQLLAKYLKKIKKESRKLAKANEELVAANEKIKTSVQHIIELYQAVHLFSTQRNKDDLIKLIIHYTKKITQAEITLFYNGYKNRTLISSDNISPDLEEQIKAKIDEIRNNLSESGLPLAVDIQGKSYVFALVKSNYKLYGILGVKAKLDKERIYIDEVFDQLMFLSRLGAIFLEKFELEEVNEKLLITEEQNRIANEIHDSVLQRLFSISCGIFGLIKNIDKTSAGKIQEKLREIRSVINDSMTELRASIYGLSSRKNGANNFINDIKKYIAETCNLNNANIDLKVNGDDELLSATQKKALYRIICEGIGNALRHGKAKNIDVTVDIQGSLTKLEITDNGQGFDTEKKADDKQEGLGIRNIHYLVNSLDGKVVFDSMAGKGTKISISIPTNRINYNKEVVV